MKYISGKIYSLFVIFQLLNFGVSFRLGFSFGYYPNNQGHEYVIYFVLFTSIIFLFYSAFYIGKKLKEKNYLQVLGVLLLTLLLSFISLFLMFAIGYGNAY